MPKPTRRSIADALRVGQVEDDELTIILNSVCPRGAQFRPTEVEYRTVQDDVVLTLTYRDGVIVDATAGPSLTTELEAELSSRIDAELVHGAKTAAVRSVLFCDRPVAGWWRYDDEFQIAPAPAYAPRADELSADHPFILEVTHHPSTWWEIQQQRARRRTYDIALVLSLALRYHLRIPGPQARKHWVLVRDPAADALRFDARWCQEGYFIEGFDQYVDELSAPGHDATPLPLVPGADYYGPGFMDYPFELSGPHELADIFATFSVLAGDERERFLRACYWQYLGSTMWSQSQSLYLTCLINSVECLASIGPERSEPEGPTLLFKALMKRLGPGAPSGTRVDNVYGARSHVTHGERLMHYDQAPFRMALDQGSAIDRQAMDDARVLSRGAILNWLWAHNPAAHGHLVSKGIDTRKPAKAGTRSSVTVITPQDEDRAGGSSSDTPSS